MTMVTTWSGRKQDLNAYTALDGGNWRIGLYTNNFTPTVGMSSSDITEPTYVGYVKQSPGAWGTAFINGSDQAQSDAPAGLVFQPTSGTSLPQTIYGWFLEDGGSPPQILAAELLPSPVTFSSTSSSLTLFPSLKVGTLA